MIILLCFAIFFILVSGHALRVFSILFSIGLIIQSLSDGNPIIFLAGVVIITISIGTCKEMFT